MEGCANKERARGLCGKHGGKADEGTTPARKQAGYCQKHGGAHGACTAAGCDDTAVAGGLARARHGANGLCTADGCTKEKKVCFVHSTGSAACSAAGGGGSLPHAEFAGTTAHPGSVPPPPPPLPPGLAQLQWLVGCARNIQVLAEAAAPSATTPVLHPAPMMLFNGASSWNNMLANAAHYAHACQATQAYETNPVGTTAMAPVASKGCGSHGNPYAQATPSGLHGMRGAASAAAAVAAASPHGNGGQAMMMAAAAAVRPKGHGNRFGAAVHAFDGGSHAAASSMHSAAGHPGLVSPPRATGATSLSASAPQAAAAHPKAVPGTWTAGTSAQQIGGFGGSLASQSHARVRTLPWAGGTRGWTSTVQTAANSGRNSKSKNGGGGKAVGSPTKAKARALSREDILFNAHATATATATATHRKTQSKRAVFKKNLAASEFAAGNIKLGVKPSGSGTASRPGSRHFTLMYNGASTYAATQYQRKPGGPNRTIKTGGEWSRWVLECGAKERNIAAREFELSDEDVVDLKKTSRRMKLLFAQRRYLQAFKGRKAGGGGGAAASEVLAEGRAPPPPPPRPPTPGSAPQALMAEGSE